MAGHKAMRERVRKSPLNSQNIRLSRPTGSIYTACYIIKARVYHAVLIPSLFNCIRLNIKYIYSQSIWSLLITLNKVFCETTLFQVNKNNSVFTTKILGLIWWDHPKKELDLYDKSEQICKIKQRFFFLLTNFLCWLCLTGRGAKSKLARVRMN